MTTFGDSYPKFDKFGEILSLIDLTYECPCNFWLYKKFFCTYQIIIIVEFRCLSCILSPSRVDDEKNRVKIKLRLPRLEMIGNYSIQGRIMMLPIAGKGICSGNYSKLYWKGYENELFFKRRITQWYWLENQISTNSTYWEKPNYEPIMILKMLAHFRWHWCCRCDAGWKNPKKRYDIL